MKIFKGSCSDQHNAKVFGFDYQNRKNQKLRLVIFSASKRNSTSQILRHLKIELKGLDLTVNKENLLPEPGEIRALLVQLDSLLDCVEGTKKKPSPNTPKRSI